MHSKKRSYDWIFYYTSDFDAISLKNKQKLKILIKIKDDKCFVAILPVFTEKIYKIKNASRYEAGKFKAS